MALDWRARLIAYVARQSLYSATLPFPQGALDRPEVVVASSRVTIKVLDIVASPTAFRTNSCLRGDVVSPCGTAPFTGRGANSHRRAGRKGGRPICGFAAVPLCKSESEQETLLRLATVPPRKREALPFASVCAMMLGSRSWMTHEVWLLPDD